MTPKIVTSSYRTGLQTGLALAFIATLCISAVAQDSTIAARRAAERKSFTDQQITTGFFKVAFHNDELPISGAVDRIRKYVVPIRVFIENRAKSNRTEKLAEVISDIAARIQNLARSYSNNLGHIIPRNAMQQPVIQLGTAIDGKILSGGILNRCQKILHVPHSLSVRALRGVNIR